MRDDGEINFIESFGLNLTLVTLFFFILKLSACAAIHIDRELGLFCLEKAVGRPDSCLSDKKGCTSKKEFHEEHMLVLLEMLVPFIPIE